MRRSIAATPATAARAGTAAAVAAAIGVALAPAAVPGAVAALAAVAALPVHAQTSSKERIEAFAKLPDWSGLWEPNVFVGEGIGQSLSASGAQAGAAILGAKVPFNAEWQAKFDAAKKAADEAAAADPAHPPAPAYNNCGSPPFIMNMMSPAIYQWRITPEETTIVDTINGIRHIYTDGRSHPPQDELWPTRTGDSVGHWEGDTLVVDTVAIKPDLLLSGFTSIRMSDQLHFVERMRRVSRDELQDELTLLDPVALTAPFKVTFAFKRVTDTNRMIDETECDSTTDRNPIVNGRFTFEAK
ncbi:MAG TPA: hypothetical protein VFO94_08675 [Gammaproteobacteria bacterium]|nr:hypothetical protein [Gammaproteobacteria bacterium]